MNEVSIQAAPTFVPYLPRLLVDWARDTPEEAFRVSDGTLVSADISGFTRLSERLQGKGRVGVEELVLLLGGCFEGLIGIAERHGGDVLKFRGDALLILFAAEGHEERACRAAAEMQWFIGQAGPRMSSVGRVSLRMSTGVHSGPCHFFLVGSSHRELVVTGPSATAVVELESEAKAGQVLVGARTAAALERSWLGHARGAARLLRLPAVEATVEAGAVNAAPPPPAAELEEFVPAPLRAHLRIEAGEAEHRQATVAFVKYTGSDGVLEQEGPEALLERLEALGRVVGEVADDFAVTWLESDVDVDGGKLYLTAGAPSSTGADEERMLRALRAVMDGTSALPLRAGVNRGPVFAGDIGARTRRTYAVLGDAVNLAARLTARAQPGQILATADVLDRSRTRFETSHQPFLMKGKERPVTAYSVGAPVGVREEEADRRLPLVDRQRELGMLREALEAARMRQFRVAELVAEPGMGKSRLVEELKTLAVGFQQLATRCEPYESAHPFFAIRSLLRPLVGITPEQSAAEAGAQLTPWVQAIMPDLAPWLPLLAIPFDAEVPPTPEVDAIDPQFRRDKLHEVVDQFVTRVLLMPTLLAVEDAHWIDDASAFLLRHLIRSPVPRPWLACVTRRPEGEAFVDHPLVLEPLPPEDANALALAAAEEAPLSAPELEALTERSGGNPLFVRELVAAAKAGGTVDGLPETVETLLTARIDRLDPSDRLLLRYASVVGPAFDLDLLREILTDQPTDPGDLDRWHRLSEFVQWESADTLRFGHDLFRAMAYEGLSFRRRREIHGRVGEALERRAGSAVDEAAGLLSLHFFEAERYAEAWRYAVVAGRRAQAMYANVVAGELYGRALAAAGHLPDLPPAEVADVAEALGDVTELAGQYPKAEAAYGRARALVPDDPAAQARLLRKEGVLRERLGRYADALRWYTRGLRAADRLLGREAAAARAELELAYAGVKHRQGRFSETIQWAEHAVSHAEEAGDRSSLAHAYYLLDVAHTRLGKRADYAEQALAIYEELDDLRGQADTLNTLGIRAYFEGRWDDALAYYEEAGEAYGRAGDVVGAARTGNNQAEILSDQGRLEEAEPRFQDALRTWKAAGYAVGVALATSNLGRLAARAGRFEDAHGLLDEAVAEFREIEAENLLLETEVRRMEYLVLEGRHKEALAVVGRVLRPVEASEAATLVRALLERLHGLALVQGREPRKAHGHFERALEVARSLGAEFEVALTLKAMADVGAPDADTLRAESEEILARLGVVSVPRVPLP